MDKTTKLGWVRYGRGRIWARRRLFVGERPSKESTYPCQAMGLRGGERRTGGVNG